MTLLISLSKSWGINPFFNLKLVSSFCLAFALLSIFLPSNSTWSCIFFIVAYTLGLFSLFSCLVSLVLEINKHKHEWVKSCYIMYTIKIIHMYTIKLSTCFLRLNVHLLFKEKKHILGVLKMWTCLQSLKTSGKSTIGTKLKHTLDQYRNNCFLSLLYPSCCFWEPETQNTRRIQRPETWNQNNRMLSKCIRNTTILDPCSFSINEHLKSMVNLPKETNFNIESKPRSWVSSLTWKIPTLCNY